MENHTEVQEESRSSKDKGFTLVELLIVIVILGILATVTVFAVRGITDKGTTSACNTDKTTLQTATEAYFAQYGTATGIPATAVLASGAKWAAAAGPPAIVASPAVAVVAKPAGSVWSPDVAGATPADSLVNAGFLRSAPTNYWVAQDGKVYVLDPKCGTVGTFVG